MTKRAAPPDLPEAQRLLREMGDKSGWQVTVLGEVPSTQTPAKEAARAGSPGFRAWTADYQSAGRGRRGRSWLSAPGRDLAFSALLRPDMEASRAPLLSLAASVAALRAIRRLAPPLPGVAVKWPNDIIVTPPPAPGAPPARKLCGIICECAARGAGLDYAVIGIGINVGGGAQDMARASEGAGQPASSLRAELEPLGLSPPGRGELLAAALIELAGAAELAASEAGREALMASYAESCATIGRDVRVIPGGGGEDFVGRAVAIAPGGELIVRGESGERTFAAADVAHLR